MKPSFRHYNAMNFLNDVLEHRQTIISLRDTIPDDIQASTSTDITDQSTSLTLNDNSSDNVFGDFFNNESNDNENISHSALSTSSTNSSSSERKKRKNQVLKNLKRRI